MAGTSGVVATALLVGALVATQVEVVWEHPLREVGWPVWVLLARNLVLAAVFIVLLLALTRRREPAGM